MPAEQNKTLISAPKGGIVEAIKGVGDVTGPLVDVISGTLLNKDTKFTLADQVTIGKNITFGPNCKSVSIGFGSYLGDDLYIDVPELVIGEYTTIHRGGTIHGYKACNIGHNCWVGQFVIIDSIGGTTIKNNVGIGAHSQLWSHMKFGMSFPVADGIARGPYWLKMMFGLLVIALFRQFMPKKDQC